MINNGFLMDSRLVIKKLSAYFVFAFLFVFSVFAANQIFLINSSFSKNQVTLYQYSTLLFYSLPSIVVMCLPFSVCIGFVQGLIKINIFEKISQGKKNIISVIFLGFVISMITFIIIDFIMPNSIIQFNKLFRSLLTNESIEIGNIGPREMSFMNLLKKMNGISINEKTANIYLLELNKKLSIPSGALFFAFFALSLSIMLQKHSKISFFISILSCILYWAMLIYGQNYSVKNGRYGGLVMWLPNILFFCISIILFLIKTKNRPSASMQTANVKGFNGA